ncbi:MAG TPA: hypothetical protein PLQ67_03640, partial [Burkholderiaceae bacterium]|nr:hypothetical protein [Burkholderiaceae bacterium]
MTGVISPPNTISVPFPLAALARSRRPATAARPSPTSTTKVSEAPAQKKEIQAALHALYGAGNPQVSDTAIRQHITAPGRTGAQVVQAAIAHGVNLDQITRAMADHEAFRPERVGQYLASAGLDKSTLVAQEVATWDRADVDQALASLSEHRQRWIAGQGVLDGLLGGVSHLAAQAQQAQAHAAERKGQLDALSAQVDQGMAQYQWLLQERAAAQALKAQAQADLTAGQSALASVNEITTRHDRRATATVNAQYHIDAAQARLGQAQQRLDQAQASIATLEAWGLPLLEAQASTRAAWEQAAAAAQTSSEIANAHTDSAAQQAQRNQALMAQMLLDHERLVAALATHPEIALAESIRASIADTGNALAQALTNQRSWTDAVLTQGVALHETASALDDQARTLGDTLNLKDQLQAHTQAQAQLTEAQHAFDAAKSTVQGAQARLDAAYQARMAANELDGKKLRAHA